MGIPWPGSLRAFVLDTRASAGLELAIGAFVLVSVAALCFDLYSRVEADTAAARVAATMADYVSRGPDTDGGTLDGKALKDLGEFLHAHELNGAADVVFVVSAFKQPAGSPAPAVKVLWSDNKLRFGDGADDTFAGHCSSRFVDTSASPPSAKLPLPAGFTMGAGEVAVVVELCARPGGAAASLAGDIYRHHVLPVRAPEKAFPAPVHARRSGAGDTETRA